MRVFACGAIGLAQPASNRNRSKAEKLNKSRVLERPASKWTRAVLALTLIAWTLGQTGGLHAETAADAALVQSTAFQAAIYGYPLLGMYRRMSEEVLDPATRKAPLDAYFHWTELATPDASPFPARNNDTLYSTAWLDLRREPAILTMPDTKGRYYTAHIMDMTTETIANIGQRLNGTEEGSFAVVGPGWHGDLPPGIKGVVHCETAFAYVLLRVLVDGPEDVANVTALQKQYSIASLSNYLTGKRGASETDAFPPYRASTAAERVAMLNTIIRASPVRARTGAWSRPSRRLASGLSNPRSPLERASLFSPKPKGTRGR